MRTATERCCTSAARHQEMDGAPQSRGRVGRARRRNHSWGSLSALPALGRGVSCLAVRVWSLWSSWPTDYSTSELP